MSLESRVRAGIQAEQRGSLDLVSQSGDLNIDINLLFHNGTGAGQADRMFSDTRTLTASSTEDLDLAGTLTDAFGATVTFARVKAVLVQASASNANNVLVGGAASNAFVNWVSDATDKVVVRPGGFVLLSVGAADATGYGVTAGTGDLLRIGNSAADSSVTYNIVVIGCSA